MLELTPFLVFHAALALGIQFEKDEERSFSIIVPGHVPPVVICQLIAEFKSGIGEMLGMKFDVLWDDETVNFPVVYTYGNEETRMRLVELGAPEAYTFSSGEQIVCKLKQHD